MASETQKLDKDELREDEFVEWLANAVQYVQDNTQAFLAGLAGFVVVLLGINYFIESQQQAQIDAAAMLGDLLIAEQSGQIDEALRKGEQLLATYAGTEASAQGTVLMGNLHFAGGNYAEAERYFSDYLANYDPIDVLAQAANNGLAACMEAQGQVEQAAQRYETIAQQHIGQAAAAQALMRAASCYGQLGDRDKQRQLLEGVVADYASFPIASRARTKLEML